VPFPGEIRPTAVAGRWYPADADTLGAEVDACLAAASADTRFADLVALVAPHAGLAYSGPVAAHAYRQLVDRDEATIVLVGPSHFVAFDGVALFPTGGFGSPFGTIGIDEEFGHRLLAATDVVRESRGPHRREHSLEMQLPFIGRLAAGKKIVPLLMGRQTGETVRALGAALGEVAAARPALLVASSDLSHYEDAATATRLDAVVIERVAAFDADGLQWALERQPGHACGGGPMVAVMLAARALGATRATVLHYADSGDVSGDKSSVVGYMAAAFGRVR
jgi:AmmeMemoRadiSam system protein B